MCKDIKIKVAEVQSATISYLIIGVFAIVFAIATETIVPIFLLCNNHSIGECIGLMVILQFPVMVFSLLFSTSIKYWRNRTKFKLYFCRFDSGIDINYIRENFYIADIDSHAVLFVDKEDQRNYLTWKLYQGYDSLYKTEVYLFE